MPVFSEPNCKWKFVLTTILVIAFMELLIIIFGSYLGFSGKIIALLISVVAFRYISDQYGDYLFNLLDYIKIKLGKASNPRVTYLDKSFP